MKAEIESLRVLNVQKENATLKARLKSNGIGSANVGGFWGAELKFAGYDNLVISGQAKTSSYIWIHDDKIEIKDASFIWGKTTWETEKLIRAKLGDERIRVASIGPAGENKVRSACIN